MHKTLIVYYSRTGNTEKVAKAIAETLHADLDAIRDVKSRDGIFGYLRSGREAWRQQLTDIQPIENSPEYYDLIVLGTPVWAGKPSSPMRTYISKHSGQLKNVAFFCTEGGSGAEKVFCHMEDLCARRPLASMTVTERDLKTGSYSQAVAAFAQSLQLSST